MSAVALGAGVFLLLALTATVFQSTESEAPALVVGPAITAVQLPAKAQAYIEESKDDFAGRLGVTADGVGLETITTPAAEDGTYVVKLEAGGRLYEFSWRYGGVLFVSEQLAPREG